MDLSVPSTQLFNLSHTPVASRESDVSTPLSERRQWPSVLGLPVNVAASKLIGSANFLKPTGRIDVFQ